MTPNDIVVPKVGLTIEEVEVVEWLVEPGDVVRAGQTVVSVNADKTEVEVAVETDGTIGVIEAQVGQTVAVGGVLARLAGTDPDGAGDESPADPVPVAPEREPVAVGGSRGDEPTWPTRQVDATAKANGQDRHRSSPLARSLAAAAGISIRRIAGSGPGGRVVARDVRRIEHRPTTRALDGATAAAGPMVLRANVDVAEALGVCAVARRRDPAVDLVHLLVWALLADRAPMRPAPPTEDRPAVVGITRHIDGSAARPIEPRDPGDLHDVVRATERALATSGEAVAPVDIVVVDVADRDVELAAPVVPSGAVAVVAAGPVGWESRMRQGERVVRPRQPLVLAVDTRRGGGDEAASALRSVCYRFAGAGDLLAQLPSVG